MSKLRITGKHLRNIDYPQGPVISVAINTMEKHYKHHALEEALGVLSNVLAEPAMFVEDKVLGNIAKMLLPKPAQTSALDDISLLNNGVHFNVFGAEFIEDGALHQMHSAARLPVAVAGALMPDAHYGYGLPIGGVLATTNAVIPYGVGVDIGCRMCLSIFDLNPDELIQRADYFARELTEATLFGCGG